MPATALAHPCASRNSHFVAAPSLLRAKAQGKHPVYPFAAARLTLCRKAGIPNRPKRPMFLNPVAARGATTSVAPVRRREGPLDLRESSASPGGRRNDGLVQRFLSTRNRLRSYIRTLVERFRSWPSWNARTTGLSFRATSSAPIAACSARVLFLPIP